MTQTPSNHALRLMAVAVVAASVAGCNVITRLSEIGDGPKITQITNPRAMPDYRPVSLPMPKPTVTIENPNSLWRAGAKAFFKDHRAKAVGDILTVQLQLDDSAKLDNKTERDRDDSEDTDVTRLLGYEAGAFADLLPEAISPAALMSFGSKHSTQGDGSIDRSEKIQLTFAAVITQIRPNGHLVFTGRQEIRVNHELRELLVTGVVRPEDIESTNIVTHDKIAEMRVAYGGRGTLSDLQRPRWGTQIWDTLFPF